MVGCRHLAHAGKLVEFVRRDLAGEAQLDLVMREVAQRFHAVHLDQPPLADDRDTITCAFDLAQDVAREKDRSALGLRLAHQGVERLLHQRVEA